MPDPRNQSTGQSAVSLNTVGLVSVTVASISYMETLSAVGYQNGFNPATGRDPDSGVRRFRSHVS
jgi:hypothetical protein